MQIVSEGVSAVAEEGPTGIRNPEMPGRTGVDFGSRRKENAGASADSLLSAGRKLAERKKCPTIHSGGEDEIGYLLPFDLTRAQVRAPLSRKELCSLSLVGGKGGEISAG